MTWRAPCLAMCVLGGCVGVAQGAQEVSVRVEVQSYRYSTGTSSDSPFQRIATMPAYVWNTEARPDLAWQSGAAAAVLRPRFAVVSQPGETHTQGWLNEGWMRWRPVDGVSLQGGREVLLWGPSMFWNPSNPFFIENNKNNPKREIAGKEFVRARWQVSSDLALTAIGQLGRGPRTVGTQRMAGFKLDWTGEEASAAAIVAAEPGKTPSWQGWAQWTANDATLVYGEVAWRVSQLYNLPAVAESATDVSIGTSRSHRGLLAVLGMSYTFENNWTLYTEYWHNGNGLDDGDARRLAQAVRTLGTRPRGVADRQLALLLEQPSPLRRNYLGVQLGGGETNDVSWKLRLTTDIDDGSVEGVVMVDKDLGDQLKLWLNLMRRAGGSATDYGRWVIDSVMIGATWYAW